MKKEKKIIIKKILKNSDLFKKDVLEKMGISQLDRLADYLVPGHNSRQI